MLALRSRGWKTPIAGEWATARPPSVPGHGSISSLASMGFHESCSGFRFASLRFVRPVSFISFRAEVLRRARLFFYVLFSLVLYYFVDLGTVQAPDWLLFGRVW